MRANPLLLTALQALLSIPFSAPLAAEPCWFWQECSKVPAVPKDGASIDSQTEEQIPVRTLSAPTLPLRKPAVPRGEVVNELSPDANTGLNHVRGVGTEPSRVDSKADETSPVKETDRIEPSDVLEITVLKVPELSQPLEVSAKGTINFPLLGELPVAGRTALEVERDLTIRLDADYLQNPNVTVDVKGHDNRRRVQLKNGAAPSDETVTSVTETNDEAVATKTASPASSGRSLSLPNSTGSAAQVAPPIPPKKGSAENSITVSGSAAPDRKKSESKPSGLGSGFSQSSPYRQY